MLGGGTSMADIPQSVKNLRRIWNERKEKFQYKQADVAEDLGWTQGAFSQYLNNITNLNSDAVIKLANFLEVSPSTIDPDFPQHDFNDKKVLFNHSDPDKQSNTTLYYRRASIMHKNDFFIAVDKKIPGLAEKGSLLWVTKLNKQTPKTMRFTTPDSEIDIHTLMGERKYYVLLKDKKQAEIINQPNLPDDNKIKEKYLILGVLFTS